VTWVDNQIVVFTTLIAAFLQVVYTLRGYSGTGTGTPYTIATSITSYIDVSPVIAGVSGVVVPPTLGGTTLTLTVEYMAPNNNYTAVITVGGAPCPILDPSGNVVPANQVIDDVLSLEQRQVLWSVRALHSPFPSAAA